MTWIFAYIGMMVAVMGVSIIGGIVWSLMSVNKDLDDFLLGAWVVAMGLAFSGCVIIFEEGLI